MVDRELVLRKAAALEGYLGELEQFQSIDLEAYRAEWKTQRVVERSMHLAIEVCLDLGDHRDADILDASLSQSLMQMARFRNLLVHDYARIEPEKVLTILRGHLGDLDAFRRRVLSQL